MLAAIVKIKDLEGNVYELPCLQGKQGDVGESAYETAVRLGIFDGNEVEWLESLKGDDGVSIVSIEKTQTSDLVDTYTITYTDGTTSSFVVTNGKDGENGREPEITIQNDIWYINGESTNVKAAGAQGASAYEVALANGFKGTEEEWLESLKVISDLSHEHENIDVLEKFEPGVDSDVSRPYYDGQPLAFINDIPSAKSYELSDEAYVHTNLPDGNKVVSYTHDGDEFGAYEWVVAGEDLTSVGTFNCSFPDNGISITPEDNGFVLTGTPLLGEQSYYFVDSDNNMDFALPDENGSIYIRSFSSSNNETIASDMLYVDIEQYGANKVFIDSSRADLSKSQARIADLNGASEAFVRIKITVKDIGVPYNHKFQIHVIAGDGEKPLNPDTTTDISYNSFVSFPYKTTVTYMADLDFRLDRIESKINQLPAQLDADLMSVIGDGVIE